MTSASYHYRQTHVISSKKRSKYKNYDGFRRCDDNDENSVREIERVATKIRFSDVEKWDKQILTIKPAKKILASLPLVDVYVNDVAIRALIDTGSQITLITKSFV